MAVTREETTWHETPKFASTDIRFSIKSGDIHEEKRSASLIVKELNLFARQGPGGLYDLNGYFVSDIVSFVRSSVPVCPSVVDHHHHSSQECQRA